MPYSNQSQVSMHGTSTVAVLYIPGVVVSKGCVVFCLDKQLYASKGQGGGRGGRRKDFVQQEFRVAFILSTEACVKFCLPSLPLFFPNLYSVVYDAQQYM